MLANSTAAAKKTDQPGIWEMQKSYLLNPENSKTFLILSQPKMCQKYTFLLPRAHFLGATGAPTEPVHESLLKTPILSRPTAEAVTNTVETGLGIELTNYLRRCSQIISYIFITSLICFAILATAAPV